MVTQQPKVNPEREAALKDFDHQANSSVVAEDRKRKLSTLAIAVAALAGIGVVWCFQNAAKPATTAPNADLTIAERKAVPKLKDQGSAAAVPPVGGSTAPAVTTATPASVTSNATASDDPLSAQREQMETQRREQERRMLEARMKSAIIPPNSGNPAAGLARSDSASSAASGERGPQDSNSRFARAVSGSGVAVSQARQLENLDYKVLQGKLIEAVLAPRAKSDLPGMVCALVQSDVYGSQGRIPLIPWGSNICGVYSAEVRKGQDRIFVVWNMLRRPDGVEVALDSIGADQLGTVGMGGHVDTHFAEIFGVSALLSIIGAGAANVGVNPSDQSNSASYYRQSVQQAAASTAQQVLQPYASMPPTITTPAGSRIRIYVNRDLDFTPVYKAEIEAAAQGGVTFIR